MRQFWLLVGYLLVAVRRALTIAWIRLNKFVSSSDGQIRPVADFHHKVVIFGDGFAEGLGDWIVLGGMAGVARQIHQLARTDNKVRMSWDFINRGRTGSVSADWLPSNEKSLYHKKVLSPACKDAEIFVVVLGTMDVVADCVGMPLAAMPKTALDTYSEDELCDTVKNIREICEALRAEGKKVIVCNVMTTGAGVNRMSGIAKRLNRQLALYARGTAEGASSTTTGGNKTDRDAIEPVQLVKLNNPRTSREDGRAFDDLHLNVRGYRSFGQMLNESLAPMMAAIEWKFWKVFLSGNDKKRRESAAPVSDVNVEPKSKEAKKID